MFDDIFMKSYPSMDLHGFDRESARVWTDDFVNENYLLGNENIIIVHGKGTGIIKKEVHDTLSKNKYVLSYKTDNFNDGMTVVKLKKYS